MRLKPFFGYFGSKYKLAKKYSPPQHDTIIEPFAGSAGYSLYYHEGRKVELCDVFEPVCAVWKYLIETPEEEIRDLPNLEEGDDLDRLDVCQAAKWLIGYWIQKASATPRTKPTKWMYDKRYAGSSWWGPKIKDRIASQQKYIRDWTITKKSYADIENRDATWFVDPPYQIQGGSYPERKIDYAHLGEWCKGRRGQVIVCEGEGATWLQPFHALDLTSRSKTASRSGTENRQRATELVWESEYAIPETESTTLVVAAPAPTGAPMMQLSVEKALALLQKARTVDEVKEIRDQAQAMSHYVRSRRASRTIQDDAAEITLHAERRLGDLSSKLPKSTPIPSKEVLNSNLPIRLKRDLLTELGLQTEVYRLEKLALISDDEIRQYVADARKGHRRISVNGALAFVRRKSSKQDETPQDLFFVAQRKLFRLASDLTDVQIDALCDWLQSCKSDRDVAA